MNETRISKLVYELHSNRKKTWRPTADQKEDGETNTHEDGTSKKMAL